jgi:hypothetical protein
MARRITVQTKLDTEKPPPIISLSSCFYISSNGKSQSTLCRFPQRG